MNNAGKNILYFWPPIIKKVKLEHFVFFFVDLRGYERHPRPPPPLWIRHYALCSWKSLCVSMEKKVVGYRRQYRPT